MRDMTSMTPETNHRIGANAKRTMHAMRTFDLLTFHLPSFRTSSYVTYELRTYVHVARMRASQCRCQHASCQCRMPPPPRRPSVSLFFFALPTPSTSMPRFWSSPQTVDAFRLSIISVVFTATAGIGGCVAFGVSDGAHYESVGYLDCVMCWLVGTRHNKCSADPQAVFPCLFILS